MRRQTMTLARLMLLSGALLLCWGCGAADGAEDGGDGGGLATGDAGDDHGSNGSGPPQAWQKSTDAIQFAKVSVGGDETLDLVDMRVAVTVEGLRARTLVDHIFYNPHDEALEGTFRYGLPTEANVSYYAMFVGTIAEEPAFFGPDDGLHELDEHEVAAAHPEAVVAAADPETWGTLRVGEIVSSVDALDVYEEITSQPIDPALVEEVAPNTFEARVFPIPAHGYNRVLIAYEQTLPRIGSALEYSFPVAAGPVHAFGFTLAAASTAIDSVTYVGDLDGVEAVETAAAPTFAAHFDGETPGGFLTFQVGMSGATDEVEVLSGTDPSRDESFFYARLHPQLAELAAAEAYSARAVFLVDTSLSEHPDQFNVNMLLLEEILQASPGITEFAVLTFDAGARWLGDGWRANDAAGRDAALDALSDVLLEGATDFGAALRTLAAPSWEVDAGEAVDVLVLSDGVITWGESTADAMIARHQAETPFHERFFVYRTGLAAENLELFAALTGTGAVFNCFSADSVPGCAVAHHAAGLKLDAVTIEGAGESPAQTRDVLIAGRQATLFPGGTLTVAGRILTPGDAVVKLTGTSGDDSLVVEARHEGGAGDHELLVDDAGGRAAARTADRRRPAVGVGRCCHFVRGDDVALGRTVEVEVAGSGHLLSQGRQVRRREDLSGEQEQPQARQRSAVEAAHPHHPAEHRGRGVPHGHALGLEQRRQGPGVATLPRVEEHDGGAVPERQEEIEDRQVDVQRGHRGEAVLARRGERGVAPVEEGQRAAVGVGDALGGARRSGGREDVGQARAVGRAGVVDRHDAVRRDRRGDATPRQDAIASGRGQLAVDRHVRGAHLERGQDGHHSADRAVGHDAHPVALGDAGAREGGGAVADTLTERAIGDALASRDGQGLPLGVLTRHLPPAPAQARGIRAGGRRGSSGVVGAQGVLLLGRGSYSRPGRTSSAARGRARSPWSSRCPGRYLPAAQQRAMILEAGGPEAYGAATARRSVPGDTLGGRRGVSEAERSRHRQ